MVSPDEELRKLRAAGVGTSARAGQASRAAAAKWARHMCSISGSE